MRLTTTNLQLSVSKMHVVYKACADLLSLWDVTASAAGAHCRMAKSSANSRPTPCRLQCSTCIIICPCMACPCYTPHVKQLVSPVVTPHTAGHHPAIFLRLRLTMTRDHTHSSGLWQTSMCGFSYVKTGGRFPWTTMVTTVAKTTLTMTVAPASFAYCGHGPICE